MNRTIKHHATKWGVVSAIAFAFILFLFTDSRDADAAAKVWWTDHTSDDIPNITTWDNSVAMDRTYTRTATLNIREMGGATVTVHAIEDLSNDITLNTQWMFTADTYLVGVNTGVSVLNQNPAQGWNNFVSTAAFMNGGVTVTAVGSDETCVFTITAQGLNPNDSGYDSDSTASPMKQTYSANLNLRADGF
ncbi:MAG: hypothetical protein O3A46_14360 [Candidatus Poribacteria bacterium]|nr:hypothetical protein [Candidatus Poribacteria bacterium]